MPTVTKHISKKKRISLKQPIVSYQHKKVTLSESIDSKKYLRIKLGKPIQDDLKYLCKNLGYVQPTKLVADLLKLTVKNLKAGKKTDKNTKKIIEVNTVNKLST